MADPTRTLHETLLSLQRQLGDTKLDPSLRRELRATLNEIRARVDAGEAAEKPLRDRVSGLMLRFETEHPALADAAGAVANALAQLGI